MKQTTSRPPQISAHVSEGTKRKLDRVSKMRGMRKAFVLEQALLYHFRALEELPEEAFLPPRLVVSQESFEKVVEWVENPPFPTMAMQELMDGIPGKSVEMPGLKAPKPSFTHFGVEEITSQSQGASW